MKLGWGLAIFLVAGLGCGSVTDGADVDADTSTIDAQATIDGAVIDSAPVIDSGPVIDGAPPIDSTPPIDSGPPDADLCGAPNGTQTFSVNGIDDTGSIQTFTVPADVCSITITALGAKGGSEGAGCGCATEGARIRGTFVVTPGEVITILVGQQGDPFTQTSTLFGGGGSFVVDSDVNPMVIAGGGGSCFSVCPPAAETVGRAVTSGGTGGTLRSDNGQGGSSANANSGGGGGFLTDGANAGGSSYTNGGNGGVSETKGGYGGGGARTGNWGQGGGGGYSGGSCGDLATTWKGCGGGGSFNGGTSPLNEAGVNNGDGSVVIDW
jgi:hypothetical protein